MSYLTSSMEGDQFAQLWFRRDWREQSASLPPMRQSAPMLPAAHELEPDRDIRIEKIQRNIVALGCVVCVVWGGWALATAWCCGLRKKGTHEETQLLHGVSEALQEGHASIWENFCQGNHRDRILIAMWQYGICMEYVLFFRNKNILE